MRDDASPLAEDICGAWGWKGIESAAIVAVNKFGNVVFVDQAGRYWRICPEELDCKVIAESREAYERLAADADFREDWDMARLVEMAQAKYGAQPVHRCFCLKAPGALGGAYEIDNIGTVGICELIRFAGDVANQIKDLPPGSKVEFRIVD
jgi:hypothetical protein